MSLYSKEAVPVAIINQETHQMVFSSTLFLFCFLPVTLAGYYICMEADRKVFEGRKELSNFWLLLMSVLFFSWSQLGYLFVIVSNILINYLGAGFIHRQKMKGELLLSRLILSLTVAVNLGILFYFKYFDFTIVTINSLFGKTISLRNIVLPIGISFFTFQAMSYTIDVYRGKAGMQKNPFKLALYVMLFPQLIAGPIVRYTDVENEIDNRKVTADDFAFGARRFIIGLGKKALIANTMAVTADSIFKEGLANNTVAIAWLGAIAYGIQIFFDFSGYSDMAIGLGRMFGFHFLENFNLPYISRSITEFWRRWHISLSTWFRDYVYIPLGGNRKGAFATYRNLLIIFLLTGIWHGAAWHYIFWGVWHGAFMLLERFFRKRQGLKGKTGFPDKGALRKSVIDVELARESIERVAEGINKEILESNEHVHEILLRVFRHVYTLLVVIIGWIFFRADSLREAAGYIKTMFGRSLGAEPGFSVMWYLDRWTVTMLIMGILFSTEIPSGAAKLLRKKFREHSKEEWFEAIRDILLMVLLLLSSMSIVSGTYNPFIYFQF